jgi:HK97 family phage portal protein
MRLFSRKQNHAPEEEKQLSRDEILTAILGGATSKAGVVVDASAAMRCSTFFNCVRFLSQSIGSLPITVYERTKGGKKIASDDHYRILLNEPNDLSTGNEMRATMVAQVLTYGKSFWQMQRGAQDRVFGLLPVAPNSLRSEVTNDYKRRFVANDGRDFSTNEILFLQDLSLDGFQSLQRIALGREAIGLAIAAERYGALLFKNGATPGGILKHPKTLGKDGAARLKAAWQAAFGGDGLHGTAVLEEGMEWVRMGMTSEDAQFLDTRKFQRIDICGLCGVPPHLVFILDHATYSNIEHQSIEFVTYHLHPWVKMIESNIERWVMTRKDRDRYFVKLNVDAFKRGDLESRIKSWRQSIECGMYSPNEARAKEDEDQRGDPYGDSYYYPANTIPTIGPVGGNNGN